MNDQFMHCFSLPISESIHSILQNHSFVVTKSCSQEISITVSRNFFIINFYLLPAIRSSRSIACAFHFPPASISLSITASHHFFIINFTAYRKKNAPNGDLFIDERYSEHFPDFIIAALCSSSFHA